MAEALNTGILRESPTRNQGSGRDSDQVARVGLGPEAQGVEEGLGSGPRCQFFRAGIAPGAQGVGAGLGPNPTGCESNVGSSRQPALKPTIWGIS